MSQNDNLRGLKFPGGMLPDPLSCLCFVCRINWKLPPMGLLWGHLSNLPPLSQNPIYTPATAIFRPPSLTGECCVKPTVPVYNACDRRTARWGRWIECYTWMECYTHHIIMQPLSLCLAYGNWLALHSWNHINAFFHICDYMNETYIW